MLNPVPKQDFTDKNGENSIDLSIILKQLARSKKTIFIITFAGFLIGCLVAITSKKVWQGEFQIVLEEKNNILPNSKNSELASFVIQNTSNINNLKTEIGILRSSSVLMEIFEFVKEQKIIKNSSNAQNLRFQDWLQTSLNIKLQNKTSILNLAYKDQDKELILPVLNKISKKYQDYSGKSRLRNIELGNNFFEDQVKYYREKSENSLTAAHIEAINYLNREDTQLEELIFIANDLKLDTSMIIQENPIPNDIKFVEDISKQIIDLKKELEYRRLIYNENDSSIQKLLLQRDALTTTLKELIKSNFENKLTSRDQKISEYKDKKGEFAKYRELMKSAYKDLATLDNLETQRIALLLEKARIKDPWELITKPTLLPSPVAPKKKKIALFGLFAGLIVGTISTTISYKLKGLIFTYEEIYSLTNWPFISKITLKNIELLKDYLMLISSSEILKNDNSKLGIYILGESTLETKSNIQEIIDQTTLNKDIEIVNNIQEITKKDKIIVLASLGLVKENELILFKQQLNIIGKNVLGVITIV